MKHRDTYLLLSTFFSGKITDVIIKIAEGIYYTFHSGEIVSSGVTLLANSYPVVFGASLALMVSFLMGRFSKRKNQNTKQYLPTKKQNKSQIRITDLTTRYYYYLKAGLTISQMAKKERVKPQTAKKHVKAVYKLIQKGTLEQF